MALQRVFWTPSSASGLWDVHFSRTLLGKHVRTSMSLDTFTKAQSKDGSFVITRRQILVMLESRQSASIPPCWMSNTDSHTLPPSLMSNFIFRQLHSRHSKRNLAAKVQREMEIKLQDDTPARVLIGYTKLVHMSHLPFETTNACKTLT